LLRSSEFSLCAKLLKASIIGDLKIILENLDGVVDPLIVFIIARARNHLEVLFYRQPQSIHSQAFIKTLFSFSISHVFLNNPSSLFQSDSFIGLSRAFWEEFLNE
ncbi:hypothetical protein PMAYCL1PPCAC_27947, partial [Pristionchus mayeri]